MNQTPDPAALSSGLLDSLFGYVDQASEIYARIRGEVDKRTTTELQTSAPTTAATAATVGAGGISPQTLILGAVAVVGIALVLRR